MLQPPKRSFISKLVMRENNPSRIDWPALLTLALYIEFFVALLVGVVYMSLVF